VLRFRRAILSGGIADTVAGKRNGVPMTFRELFEFVLGEPLERTPTNTAANSCMIEGAP
jgi:hypothetical protein